MILTQKLICLNYGDFYHYHSTFYQAALSLIRVQKLPLLYTQIELYKEQHEIFFSFSTAANKYCPLLIKEGGISLLEKVLELESSQPGTRDMAR